jgi:DNA uptake protein ComE-like DNA-binding protein
MKRTLTAAALALALPCCCHPRPAANSSSPERAAFPDSGPKTSTVLVDINTATTQELMALPGIGQAYSARIIKGRPYRAKNELLQKDILPQSVYEKVKDLIVARRSPDARRSRPPAQ